MKYLLRMRFFWEGGEICLIKDLFTEFPLTEGMILWNLRKRELGMDESEDTVERIDFDVELMRPIVTLEDRDWRGYSYDEELFAKELDFYYFSNGWRR